VKRAALIIYFAFLTSCAPRAIVAPALMQATVSNVRASEVIKTQGRAITEQKLSIQDALTRAELIKNKVIQNNAVLETDVAPLIDSIKTVQSRNLFLENSNADLTVINDEQKASLNETVKESAAIQEELAKTKTLAAKSGVYRNWILGLAGAISLYFLVMGFLKIYKPPFF
jgi:DNA primase large subunit